ncbi:hypothetical protein H4Q26_010615 [Puccinia striiformis f. sp. tritici PST-130]|nr:hypothetical protein H4Q26_010615 [Puccinia striiformis f. sp. tritici PST-130]
MDMTPSPSDYAIQSTALHQLMLKQPRPIPRVPTRPSVYRMLPRMYLGTALCRQHDSSNQKRWLLAFQNRSKRNGPSQRPANYTSMRGSLRSFNKKAISNIDPPGEGSEVKFDVGYQHRYGRGHLSNLNFYGMERPSSGATTKYGLATARKANGESNVTYFKPRSINVLSALFYSVPLLFGGIPICLLVKAISEINRTFTEHNQNYSRIMSGSIEGEEILEVNLKALDQIASMQQASKKVTFLARCEIPNRNFSEVIRPTNSFAIGPEAIETPSRLQSMSVSDSYDASSGHSSRQRHWISSRLPDWLPTLRQAHTSLKSPVDRPLRPNHAHLVYSNGKVLIKH